MAQARLARQQSATSWRSLTAAAAFNGLPREEGERAQRAAPLAAACWGWSRILAALARSARLRSRSTAARWPTPTATTTRTRRSFRPSRTVATATTSCPAALRALAAHSCQATACMAAFSRGARPPAPAAGQSISLLRDCSWLWTRCAARLTCIAHPWSLRACQSTSPAAPAAHSCSLGAGACSQPAGPPRNPASAPPGAAASAATADPPQTPRQQRAARSQRATLRCCSSRLQRSTSSASSAWGSCMRSRWACCRGWWPTWRTSAACRSSVWSAASHSR
mmetsp:Transcript_33534/g.99841  ORF Transcript_33534/g.99841 Transcript_33534/m.99841 type:complete len:280 (+) Transcript_33534:852-1691(+)